MEISNMSYNTWMHVEGGCLGDCSSTKENLDKLKSRNRGNGTDYLAHVCRRRTRFDVRDDRVIGPGPHISVGWPTPSLDERERVRAIRDGTPRLSFPLLLPLRPTVVTCIVLPSIPLFLSHLFLGKTTPACYAGSLAAA